MSVNKQTQPNKTTPNPYTRTIKPKLYPKAIESLKMQFTFLPSLNLERYSLPCMGFQALQLVKVEMGFLQFQILQNLPNVGRARE